MAYEALIARITSIRLIEGSDYIQLATVNGFQVIVGLNVNEGDLGVFLEAGGQLSEELALSNDLISRTDEQGNPAGGYFKENRRVRAIKLRGAKSEGFFGPLSLLAYTKYDLTRLKEGDHFSELNGLAVCNKYFTPATLRAMKRGGKPPRENAMFAKHVDTDNIKKSGSNIRLGAILHISEKIHGTSARTGYVLEKTEIPLNYLSRLWYRLTGKATTRKEWTLLIGSRNMILGKPGAKAYYEDEGFRSRVVTGIVLRKGEILYGEIVGWESEGRPIMSRQDVSALKNKALEKRFGKTLTYAYGQPDGHAKFYVYRITTVNDDGIVTEYSKVQVDARAKELGLDVVPHIDTFVYDGNLAALLQRLDFLVDGDGLTPCSSLDPSHIQEGVVIRVESEEGTRFHKMKSLDFGLAEGYAREKDDFVDQEEVS